MDITAYKWVPVIDHDACTGCGECVKACDRKCIELVWDFATFKRPDHCGSCGDCETACKDRVIRMGWVNMTGNITVGQWCEKPEVLSAPLQSRWKFKSLFSR